MLKRQPHLDRRALHQFYGSRAHYILLFVLTFVAINCLILAVHHTYHNMRAKSADAFIQYNMSQSALGSDAAQPNLQFIDPDYGEINYVVFDPKLKAQLSQHYQDNPLIHIRYEIEPSSDITYLQLHSGWLMWSSSIISGIVGLVLLYSLIKLSPRPRWYWQHAKQRFAKLSKNYVCLEVRVKQLQEIKHLQGSSQRICRISGSVYIHTQNTYVDVESANFIVESSFYMSYPLMTVYFNPKNVHDYEVDLIDFLQHNASSLHGYQEKQRDYFHADTHVAI
jgi:hypothetical protein